jgi:hypothetical protein
MESRVAFDDQQSFSKALVVILKSIIENCMITDCPLFSIAVFTKNVVYEGNMTRITEYMARHDTDIVTKLLMERYVLKITHILTKITHILINNSKHQHSDNVTEEINLL